MPSSCCTIWWRRCARQAGGGSAGCLRDRAVAEGSPTVGLSQRDSDAAHRGLFTGDCDAAPGVAGGERAAVCAWRAAAQRRRQGVVVLRGNARSLMAPRTALFRAALRTTEPSLATRPLGSFVGPGQCASSRASPRVQFHAQRGIWPCGWVSRGRRHQPMPVEQ